MVSVSKLYSKGYYAERRRFVLVFRQREASRKLSQSYLEISYGHQASTIRKSMRTTEPESNEQFHASHTGSDGRLRMTWNAEFQVGLRPTLVV